MRLHILDFNAGEPNRGTAALSALAGAAGASVRIHDVRRGAALPGTLDGVWILGGGPGSPLDPGAWRDPVGAALRARVAGGRPTLAICYGFEVMAQAFGAELRRLAAPRTGVLPIRLTAAGAEDALLAGLDGGGAWERRDWGVFGGEGDALAEGPEGDRTAVRFGAAAAGVIFHPEADLGEGTARVFTAILPRFLGSAR